MIENFGMGSVTNCEQLKKFECKNKVCTNGTIFIKEECKEKCTNDKDFKKYIKECVIVPSVTTSPLILEQKKVIKKMTDLKITLQKKISLQETNLLTEKAKVNKIQNELKALRAKPTIDPNTLKTAQDNLKKEQDKVNKIQNELTALKSKNKQKLDHYEIILKQKLPRELNEICEKAKLLNTGACNNICGTMMNTNDSFDKEFARCYFGDMQKKSDINGICYEHENCKKGLYCDPKSKICVKRNINKTTPPKLKKIQNELKALKAKFTLDLNTAQSNLNKIHNELKITKNQKKSLQLEFLKTDCDKILFDRLHGNNLFDDIIGKKIMENVKKINKNEMTMCDLVKDVQKMLYEDEDLQKCCSEIDMVGSIANKFWEHSKMTWRQSCKNTNYPTCLKPVKCTKDSDCKNDFYCKTKDDKSSICIKKISVQNTTPPKSK